MSLELKKFGGVDIEGIGQFLTKNAMIAFGFSIMNYNEEEVDSFKAFMSIPDGRVWEQRCIDEFWSKQQEILDSIKLQMKDPKQEMERFATWLDEMDLKHGSDLIVLSDNGI